MQLLPILFPFFLLTETTCTMFVCLYVCMCVFVCSRGAHTQKRFLYSFVIYYHVECLGLYVPSFEFNRTKNDNQAIEVKVII